MGERESGYAAWRAEQERNDPGARALEAIGIDPKTKRAISPDPPRYPPGPIAICIEPWQPTYDEFVKRVTRIAGSDIVVVVTDEKVDALPEDCFGVVGLEMWLPQLECVRRGLEVHMLATMRAVEVEWDRMNSSLPGHRTIGYEEDWRAVVDEEARKLVRAHNEATQHHVASLLSPSDVGKPTVFSRQIMGQSGQVYDFERIVGLGGTAIVAAVRDEEGTRFAAKALSAHRFPIENREERFELEGRLLIEVKHPNVLAAVDLATMDEDTPVLVFEYLAGGSVHARLATGRPDRAVAESGCAKRCGAWTLCRRGESSIATSPPRTSCSTVRTAWSSPTSAPRGTSTTPPSPPPPIGSGL